MTAASIPANSKKMKAATPVGAIPANVSESDRAIVMTGLALFRRFRGTADIKHALIRVAPIYEYTPLGLLAGPHDE
jgi:hypothetical protein